MATITSQQLYDAMKPRPVERANFFNAEPIRNTTAVVKSADLSKYKNIMLYAENGLNQPVTLIMRIGGKPIRVYENDDIVVPTGNNIYLLNANAPWLDFACFQTLEIQAKCNVAPTTGTLIVYAFGVPN